MTSPRSTHSAVTMTSGDQEHSDTSWGQARAFPCSKKSVCNYIKGYACPGAAEMDLAVCEAAHSTMQSTDSILINLTAKTAP